MNIKEHQNKILIIILSFLIYNISITTCHSHLSEEEINQDINNSIITYGSALRIENFMTKFHLYSNKYQWATGSRMQIITSLRQKDDPNAVWVIKEGHDLEPKATGTPVMCDDIIRLEHSTTGKNLHSHDHRSWISEGQEACGYGEDGEGDVNDSFIIMCYGNNGNIVRGETNFFLKHYGTQKYLYINLKSSLFDERNCRNCPIINQREVSLTDHKDKQCIWKVAGGLLFKPIDEKKENN